MRPSGIQCTKCLYTTNHPLGLVLNKEGVCSGCLVHEEKDKLDWSNRFKLLKKITDSYKSNNNYDCIVPITGGQDSFYTAHIVINELNLNPLFVNFNRNFNSAVGLKNLAQLRTIFPADFRQFTINPVIARKVVRTTMINMGTLNWLWIAGQTSLPVRIASDLNIPLIIWGGHQGVEQVGMYSHTDEVEMTLRYRKEHDLMGIDENDIFRFDPDFSPKDLSCISYPSDEQLNKNGTRGIYLSNYLRWDPVQQHEFVRNKYGYVGQKSNRTYYEFDNPDCPVYNNLQDLLKFVRLGYGKVTDQLVRDIRHKRINLAKAQRLEKKYLSKMPSEISNFANWLGISSENLNILVLSLVNNFSEQILTENWRNYFSDFSENSFRKRKFNDLMDKDYLNFGKGI